MPGALVTGDELRNSAITLDKEMRGHLQAGNAGEIGMLIRIQTVLKKRLHLARAKLPRRQADVMDHQQRNFAQRSLIEVRRWAALDAIAPATGRVQLHKDSLNEPPL